ncbi:MAG: energy transducer TonB [Bacteroidales bacterium]|jgi:protein TonB
MNIKKERIPDFDDLLFKSRNREYGAYMLRKKYKAVVIAGILIASMIGSLAVLIPFLLSRSSEHVFSGGSRFIQVRMETLPPPKEELIVPPAPPPPPPKTIQEQVKYVPPVVVDTMVPIEKSPVSNDELLANKEKQDDINTNTGYGDDQLYGDIGSGDGDSFFLVEVMPLFRGGGIDRFRQWVQARTNYPKEAIDKKIKGTVYLTFIVEKDGSISTVTIIQGVNPLLDNEAARVISESPKWTPGQQRGKPVRVRYKIPMNFTF